MGEQWFITQEDEEIYRRRLFARASNGEGKAKDELQQTYGVRLWSERERSQLVYDNPKYKTKPRQHKKGEGAPR